MEIKDFPLGLGSDAFGTVIDEKECFALLDRFRDFGGRLVDTARVYGMWGKEGVNASECVIGRWLKSRGEGEMLIATKGAHYTLDKPFIPRLHREEIAADLEESLRTLGLDSIGFYWLHRDDPSMPVGEILETMEEFVRRGDIRAYGASNYTASRMREAKVYALAHGLQGFTALSNAYSEAALNPLPPHDPTLVRSGEEENGFCRETGTPLVAYSSTDRGLFAKWIAGGEIPENLKPLYENPENAALCREIARESRESGISVQATVLKRLMHKDFRIIPLTSVRTQAQLDDVEKAIQ